jgi:hypothetical protein
METNLLSNLDIAAITLNHEHHVVEKPNNCRTHNLDKAINSLVPAYRDCQTITVGVDDPVEISFSTIKSISIQRTDDFNDGEFQNEHDKLVLTINETNGKQNRFSINIGQLLSKLSMVSKTVDGTATKDQIYFEHLFHSLSLREQEVLTEVAIGNTSSEISQKLFISTNTVKNHRKNIKKKLGIKDGNVYSRFLKWSLAYAGNT